MNKRGLLFLALLLLFSVTLVQIVVAAESGSVPINSPDNQITPVQIGLTSALTTRAITGKTEESPEILVFFINDKNQIADNSVNKADNLLKQAKSLRGQKWPWEGKNSNRELQAKALESQANLAQGIALKNYNDIINLDSSRAHYGIALVMLQRGNHGSALENLLEARRDADPVSYDFIDSKMSQVVFDRELNLDEEGRQDLLKTGKAAIVGRNEADLDAYLRATIQGRSDAQDTFSDEARASMDDFLNKNALTRNLLDDFRFPYIAMTGNLFKFAQKSRNQVDESKAINLVLTLKKKGIIKNLMDLSSESINLESANNDPALLNYYQSQIAIFQKTDIYQSLSVQNGALHIKEADLAKIKSAGELVEGGPTVKFLKDWVVPSPGGLILMYGGGKVLSATGGFIANKIKNKFFTMSLNELDYALAELDQPGSIFLPKQGSNIAEKSGGVFVSEPIKQRLGKLAGVPAGELESALAKRELTAAEKSAEKQLGAKLGGTVVSGEISRQVEERIATRLLSKLRIGGKELRQIGKLIGGKKTGGLTAQIIKTDIEQSAIQLSKPTLRLLPGQTLEDILGVPSGTEIKTYYIKATNVYQEINGKPRYTIGFSLGSESHGLIAKETSGHILTESSKAVGYQGEAYVYELGGQKFVKFGRFYENSGTIVRLKIDIDSKPFNNAMLEMMGDELFIGAKPTVILKAD